VHYNLSAPATNGYARAAPNRDLFVMSGAAATRKSRHETVDSGLASKFAAHNYDQVMSDGRAGDRPTTLADIARTLGVSVGAVSTALNGRPGVGESLRRTIEQTAAQMGYSRNRSAVALRTRRSGMVGLLIRNLRNPFFLDLAEGFERECAAHGTEVLIGSSDNDLDREQALVRAFADRAVDALALAPIGGGTAGESWQMITGAPLVLINAAQYAPHLSALRIHSDGKTAIETAVHHLLALGHRRISLVAVQPSAEADRTEYFEAAMRSVGLRPGIMLTAGTSWAAVERAVTADRARGPARRATALITNSDYAAHGVYAAARRLGIDVPGDLSVFGNDDLDTSALLSPPLTTHYIDRRGMGQVAARILLEALSAKAPPGGPTQVVLAVSLRLRGSTAAPPGTAGPHPQRPELKQALPVRRPI
jgi:DNA-binding LacI/PurR family transcriptional regulator